MDAGRKWKKSKDKTSWQQETFSHQKYASTLICLNKCIKSYLKNLHCHRSATNTTVRCKTSAMRQKLSQRPKVIYFFFKKKLGLSWTLALTQNKTMIRNKWILKHKNCINIQRIPSTTLFHSIMNGLAIYYGGHRIQEHFFLLFF